MSHNITKQSVLFENLSKLGPPEGRTRLVQRFLNGQ